ncbi:hypothetical protein Bca4012_010255 [Brassica carinata]
MNDSMCSQQRSCLLDIPGERFSRAPHLSAVSTPHICFLLWRSSSQSWFLSAQVDLPVGLTLFKPELSLGSRRPDMKKYWQPP